MARPRGKPSGNRAPTNVGCPVQTTKPHAAGAPVETYDAPVWIGSRLKLAEQLGESGMASPKDRDTADHAPR